jgi:hypothetical protein
MDRELLKRQPAKDPLEEVSNIYMREFLRELRNDLDNWQGEIEPCSPLSEFISHHWCRKILIKIKPWEDAVPFLIGQLELCSRYGLLVRALLTSLTGINPVPPEGECDALVIQSKWTQWASEHGVEPLLIEFDMQFTS